MNILFDALQLVYIFESCCTHPSIAVAKAFGFFPILLDGCQLGGFLVSLRSNFRLECEMKERERG